MSATNILQWQGYNSFLLESNGRIESSSFVVNPESVISLSFGVYSASSLSVAERVRVRWLGANGLQVGAWVGSYSYEPGGFGRQEFPAIEPPVGAQRAVLELTSRTGERIYISQPKVENGALVTAFTNNYQGQLSKMTATGFYTGTIQAENVVLKGAGLDKEIAIINSRQISFNEEIGRNRNNISSLTARALTLESTTSAQSGRLTRIEAGEITLSSSTRGRLAGMALTSDALTFESTGAYLRISTIASDGYFIYAGSSGYGADRRFLLDRQGRINAKDVTLTGNITATSGKIGGFTIDGNRLISSNNSRTMRISGLGSDDFLYMYNPGNSSLFRVDSNGVVTANNVNITGAVTANSSSSIGGRLNSVTGTLNGVGGSVYGLGGSVYGLGGSIGSYGSYMGGYYGGGTYGTISSASGYLGGVQYYGISGRLVLEGALTPGGIVTAYAGINCGSAQGSFGTVLYSQLTKKSDERLKQKITRPIQDFAQMIYDLPIKDYEYISAPNKRQLGVIAQEINQTQERWVSQRLVGHNEDGYLNIDYENLYMAGLIAIQELNERVKRLEGVI